MANLRVVQELEEGPSSNRFRIIEKVDTVDGPRDRITDHSYPTLEEALREIDRYSIHG